MINRYLSNDSKWDVGKNFRNVISVERQATVAIAVTDVRSVPTPTKVARNAEAPKVSKPAEVASSPSRNVILVETQTTVIEDPSTSRPTEPAGGVRLDWNEEGDEWVEVDYPSS